jgi:uncharacterized protein YceK
VKDAPMTAKRGSCMKRRFEFQQRPGRTDMFRIVIFLVCTIAISGCDAVNTITEGTKQADAVAADLEKIIGMKPWVGLNWKNGQLTSVTVAFPQIYDAKPSQAVAEMVRDAVGKDFKQKPDNIVLSFSLGRRL